jgi:hypothetical protein
VQRLGGEIRVSDGSGAEFTVRLPKTRASTPITVAVAEAVAR